MVLPSEWTYRKSTLQESSVLFDGVNDLVDLGNQATLWSKSLTKFSLSFWMFPTATDINDRFTVKHGDFATAQSFIVFHFDAGSDGQRPQVSFQIRDSGNSPVEAASDFAAVVLNFWNHITCVYDSTLVDQNLKIYVNGVLQQSTGDLTQAINLSVALTLGDLTNDFKGQLKDFKFWDTTALTGQNVIDLYNGKRSLVPTPQYWLPMNEGQSTPKDNIGALTTTFNGATWTTNNGATSIGGAPDLGGSGLIDPNAENNIWPTAPSTEVRYGSTKYRLIYIRYTGSESPVKDCSFAKFKDTEDGTTKVSWAHDPSIPLPNYQHNPPQFFDGVDDVVSQADAPALRLTTFTLMAWARIYRKGEEMCIVGKGGFGSDTAGQNDNYSLRVMSGGSIRGGFEEGNGTDHYATSATGFDDGKLHYFVVTYDGAIIRLYIDGVEVDTHVTNTTPETVNTNPLSIGKNPRASDRFLLGDVDEVRVYNAVWTAEEILNYWNSGTLVRAANLQYSNTFGTVDTSLTGQRLVNEVEEPYGNADWQDVADGVPSPANLPEFKTNQYYPIVLKYELIGTNIETSIENDLSSFRTYFAVQPTQTGGGEDGGGQTPGANEDQVFVYNGDWGEESQTVTMANHAKSLNPTAVWTGGDNHYASNIDEFVDIMKDAGLLDILEVAIGNHDSLSQVKGQFGYSNGYHSHRYGNVFVLFLDSENSPTGSAQVNFGKAELQQARSDNTIDWIIVIFHRPIYTANTNHDPDEANMRSTWSPIFEQYKVDLVLNAHNHNIQRTYPVKNQSNNNPAIQQADAGPYVNWPGIVFASDGTGGHDKGSALYSLGNTPAFNAYQNDTQNMNLKIATSGNGKTLTCSYIDTGGSVKHSWVHIRS